MFFLCQKSTYYISRWHSDSFYGVSWFDLFYDIVSACDYVVSSGKLLVNDELERIRKDAFMAM